MNLKVLFLGHITSMKVISFTNIFLDMRQLSFKMSVLRCRCCVAFQTNVSAVYFSYCCTWVLWKGVLHARFSVRVRERERVSMCIKGGFSSENIPQFLAPRWVTGWLSWESTSEGLIGRTGFGEHKRYLIPSVEWGSALIWVLVSSTYSSEEWTGTMLCLKFVPSYCNVAFYFVVLRRSKMGLWISWWVWL